MFQRRPARYNRVRDVSALNQDVNYNIVELLDNSTATTINGEDKEKRHAKNNIVGFDTRTVKFFDGKKAYDVGFSIANMKNGEKVAYAKKFFGYDAALTKEIQPAETASDSALSDASKSPVNQQSELINSMPQAGDSVNSKFSLDIDRLDKTVRSIDKAGLEKGLEKLSDVKNIGSFAFKDPSRFFDAISEGNRDLRNSLHEIFEAPHSNATGEYARNMKQAQERVLEIAKRAGILSGNGKKFDKKLSGAVQDYGEGYTQKYGVITVEARVKDAETVEVSYRKNGQKVTSDMTLDDIKRNFGQSRFLAFTTSNSYIKSSCRMQLLFKRQIG